MRSFRMAKSIPIIAIVGGIGSGKSTVAAEFGRLGCTVLDADRIAHGLLANPKVQQELVSCFGPGIVDTQGQIDRRTLGSAAFENEENVRKINGILHPRVLAECIETIRKCRQDSNCRGIVLDAPLLLEAGWEGRYDRLVFVECPPQIRVQRAAKKGLTPEDIKKRENFQISLDKKRQMADYIIQNNSGLFAVAEQVERIFTALNDNR